jgi:hypothetical protein
MVASHLLPDVTSFTLPPKHGMGMPKPWQKITETADRT